MKFFNLHTHYSTNAINTIELVNQYPLEFDEKIPNSSIGIHPWKIIAENIETEFRIIESKIQNEHCLAIGECGLDKRIEIPLNEQIIVFERQLLLAQKYLKPVVIHCVASFQELIEIKKELSISIPMIIHGFSKNEIVAKQLIENGFYLSFGKNLLQNPELKTVFQCIPNDRLFLETDTIEKSINEIYALASSYKKIKIDELQKIIYSNFEFVFKNKH